ncbi:MAG: hypothetical protein ACHREM_11345 [Polyangiales bacterium]
MTTTRVLRFMLALAAPACSGTVQFATTEASTTDAPPHDGLSSDAACVTPTVGAICSSSDIACSTGGDPCCVGFVWECAPRSGSSTYVWTKVELGCPCAADAGSSGQFLCGPTVPCAAADLCVDRAPGIEPADGGPIPDNYSCTTMPVECAATPTCACIEKHLPPYCIGSCTADSSGHPTVHCMGV